MSFRVITQPNVARNPVSKAVARVKLDRQLRSIKLRAFSMADGDDCSALITEIHLMLAVVAMAGAMDPKVGQHDSGVRIIRGGLSACEQMARTKRWASINAVSIEMSVNAAEEIGRSVGSGYLVAAWTKLTNGVSL